MPHLTEGTHSPTVHPFSPIINEFLKEFSSESIQTSLNGNETQRTEATYFDTEDENKRVTSGRVSTLSKKDKRQQSDLALENEILADENERNNHQNIKHEETPTDLDSYRKQNTADVTSSINSVIVNVENRTTSSKSHRFRPKSVNRFNSDINENATCKRTHHEVRRVSDTHGANTEKSSTNRRRLSSWKDLSSRPKTPLDKYQRNHRRTFAVYLEKVRKENCLPSIKR